MSATLYVIATPIGNLEDLTPRARQTLAIVDLIAAEDTRHTGRLLTSIGVKGRLLALHEHNETRQTGRLIKALEGGDSVALVSDAGTPLVSDPGFRLVRAAHAAGIRVSPVPGPSAVMAALAAAGLPTDRFAFEGFLPAKAAARRRRLEALSGEPRTLVFFEAVHRIRDCVAAMADVFGTDRPAFVGRELTKRHEQCLNATLGDIVAALDTGDVPAKGEFVVVVGGAAGERVTGLETDRLLRELAAVLSAKQAAAIAARLTDEKRNALYARLLELKLE